MNLTRKSFLKRAGAFLSSLLFWKSTPAKDDLFCILDVPPFPSDEFEKDGLKYIMWFIDKHLGETVGEDPWIRDEGGPLVWPPKPPKDQVFTHIMSLFQRCEDRDSGMVYMTKWGSDDFSPVFESTSHHDAIQKAATWALNLPNAKVRGYQLFIYEPS